MGDRTKRSVIITKSLCADIEIVEWKSLCEEEIRRLRACEIVLMRQLKSRLDEIEAEHERDSAI